MKSILSIMLSVSLLSGCSSLFPSEQDTQVNALESGDEQGGTYQSSAVNSSLDFRNQAQNALHNNRQQEYHPATPQQQDMPMVDNVEQVAAQGLNKNINYYMRGLMQNLAENLEYVSSTTPVAVTSFVMLDGDYNESNLLGIQISESLMHEVHKMGIPIIDFKTTDYIRVTPDGDFTYSKDFLELSNSSPILYVVAGTMLKYEGGYLLNARIVGVESKAVVASAQTFIPDAVANAVLGNSREVLLKEASEMSLPTPVVSIIQG